MRAKMAIHQPLPVALLTRVLEYQVLPRISSVSVRHLARLSSRWSVVSLNRQTRVVVLSCRSWRSPRMVSIWWSFCDSTIGQTKDVDRTRERWLYFLFSVYHILNRQQLLKGPYNHTLQQSSFTKNNTIFISF